MEEMRVKIEGFESQLKEAEKEMKEILLNGKLENILIFMEVMQKMKGLT